MMRLVSEWLEIGGEGQTDRVARGRAVAVQGDYRGLGYVSVSSHSTSSSIWVGCCICSVRLNAVSVKLTLSPKLALNKITNWERDTVKKEKEKKKAHKHPF